jgi:hypothetical protein
MLHLAQVQYNQISQKSELRLLAQKESEYQWILSPKEQVIPSPQKSGLTEGLLVMVELSDDHTIVEIYSAKDWILGIVEKFLGAGVSPEFLQQESERVEKWRQELTLQNQDLGRRQWEIEARREQLQALEAELRNLEEELKQKKEESP